MTSRIVIALALVTGSGLAAADIAPVPAERPSSGAPAGMARPSIIAPMPPSISTPPPPPQPPQPRVIAAPAAEIAKLGKALAGTYKCKGVSMTGDGSSTPLQATVTIKLDLDNAWIVVSLAEDHKGGVKFTEYRTYDATSKQWTRIQLANTGGFVTSTSLGESDGKWQWEGTASSAHGTMQLRDYEQHDGKQLKVWGEAMMSGSWQKQYEATCRR